MHVRDGVEKQLRLFVTNGTVTRYCQGQKAFSARIIPAVISIRMVGLITGTVLPFYNSIVDGLLLFAYLFLAPLIVGVTYVW
jgi:hypothetical protein